MTDWQTYKRTDREKTVIQTDGLADKQANECTDEQANRQRTDRETN